MKKARLLNLKGEEKNQRQMILIPKIWLLGDFFGWMKLLVRNRLSVDWRCRHWLVLISISTMGHTLLGYVQELNWGRKIKNTKIEHAPLFIVGHWRSGTTLLHELLTLDERHNYPDSYACFDPNHILLTGKIGPRLLRSALPPRRHTDSMAMSWHNPQENEFALCNLGLPSPYLTIAFPNHPPQYPEYFDLENVPPGDLDRWKEYFMGFLKQITLSDPRRIVLKSPTHTYRIKILLKLFPDAQFVHIVRNPYEVFPSTLKLWKANYNGNGLQIPRFTGLEDYIFDIYSRMFAKLEETRHLLNSSNFYELRYEDLVRDPVGMMRAIYDHLGLGDFEQVLPRVNQYLEARADYTAERYELEPELIDTITRRGGELSVGMAITLNNGVTESRLTVSKPVVALG